jgi:hypothetical protein
MPFVPESPVNAPFSFPYFSFWLELFGKLDLSGQGQPNAHREPGLKRAPGKAQNQEYRARIKASWNHDQTFVFQI